jgi:hypothetical protein
MKKVILAALVGLSFASAAVADPFVVSLTNSSTVIVTFAAFDAFGNKIVDINVPAATTTGPGVGVLDVTVPRFGKFALKAFKFNGNPISDGDTRKDKKACKDNPTNATVSTYGTVSQLGLVCTQTY